jgi:triacylglycerol lipase
MTLPTIIDVAIGLALMFFILSTLGSVLAEFVAAHQKWRHILLRQTVTRLLEPESTRKFWTHSLILPLFNRAPRAIATPKADSPDTAAAATTPAPAKSSAAPHSQAKSSWYAPITRPVSRMMRSLRIQVADAPAYLEANHFASVVLDLATGQGAIGRMPNTAAAWEFAIRTHIPSKPGENNDLQDRLLAILRQVPPDVADFRASFKDGVAKWYDVAMVRASGEYRRKLQKALFIIGCILAVVFNGDALRVATVLYQSPALRAQVAQQAETLVQANNATQADAELKEQLKGNVTQLRDLTKIGFPIGWAPDWRDNFILKSDVPQSKPGLAAYFAKLAGLLASALAVCLGAPFWYDLLGRLVKLRSSAGSDAEKKKADGPVASLISGIVGSGDAPTTSSPQSASAPALAAPRQLPTFHDALSSAGTGFTTARASWLAQIADRAYETNRETARSWLLQHNQTNVQFFDVPGTNTQAFLSWGDGVALLAFRGTEKNLTDWTTDAKFELVDATAHGLPGKIHHGFAAALESVWPALLTALNGLKNQRVLLHVTGHSLGGALATLAALRLTRLRTLPVQSVHTFGSPRVGDETFATAFDAALAGRAYRIVNNEDLVTRIPPRETGYKHVGTIIYIDESGKIQRDIGYWYRFLNFAVNALEDLKKALQTTVKDHSMTLYCGHLERAARKPETVV